MTVAKAQYPCIEGEGKPGSPDFQARIGALYNVAFTIKMARKFAGRDYAVSKLEGLWWGGPEHWKWKLIGAEESVNSAAA